MPSLSQPPLRRAAPPRSDGVLGLMAVNPLERLIEAAQIFDRRRQLLVVRRILFQVLGEARRVRDLRPPVGSADAPDPEPVLGEGGGGDPCPGGGADTIRIAAVSAGCAAARANGTGAAATGAWRRCGSFAIWASRSFTVCGRSAGSLASTLAKRTSSSSGSALFSLAAEGTGALTVA